VAIEFVKIGFGVKPKLMDITK